MSESFGVGEDACLRHVWLGILFGLFCAAFVSVFTGGYVTAERYVYFWDYAIYWHFFRDLGSWLCSDPGEAMRRVFRSIGESDYNFLPVLPLAGVACVFGGSRLAYMLAIAGISVLSSALLGARFVVSLAPTSESSGKVAVFTIATLLFLWLHPVWIPVLEGRPDVIGLAVLFWVLSAYAKAPLREQAIPALLLIGALLTTAFLLRRWYAYWSAAFFPSAFVADLVRSSSTERGKALLRTVGALSVIGLATALTGLLVAFPLVRRILETDYSVAYSAYKVSSSATEAFLRAVAYFGAPLLVASGLGLALLSIRSRTRYMAVFLVVQGAILSVLFLRVQDFNPHHYYLFLPLLFVGVSALLVWPPAIRARGGPAFFWAAGGLAYVCLCSLVVFSAHWRERMPRESSNLFPKATYFPKVREDFDQLAAILVELEKQYSRSPGRIYVIASSVRLNDSLLRNFCVDRALGTLRCSDIVGGGNVDRRDGFPRDVLSSDYVVLATPAQYHLRAESQRAVGLLARDFSAGQGIARSYSPVGSPVILEGGVEVEIFKRDKPIPAEAVSALSRELIALYPELEKLFSCPEDCLKEGQRPSPVGAEDRSNP